jgi:hypothetical protein
MARSANRRHVMGTIGRAHVEKTFALDQVVGRWSDLFTELLSAPAR